MMLQDKNFKIALVTYTLSHGGLERTVANYSRLFHEMGFEVHIYVIDSEIKYDFKGILHVLNADKYKGLKKISRYVSLIKSIRDETFDLIVDHRYRTKAFQEFFWQYLIYSGENVVNVIHNPQLQYYLTNLPNLSKLIFKNREFITVSSGISDKIRGLNLPVHLKTIYNPVYIPYGVELSPAQQNYFLAVARMDKSNVKQIDVLLKCFSESRLPQKKYRLKIVGDGVLKTRMEALSRELKIDHLVDFLGFLSDPYAIMKGAYCTVLSSRFEGLGMALAESLLCGTPVVSYDCEAGPSEIIQNRINGLLVENQNTAAFTDALNEVVEDPVLYQQLKANAKKSAEKFSPTIIKQQWLEVARDFNDKR